MPKLVNYDEAIGPIPKSIVREWWICFVQYNGERGRAGPYTREEAEQRMRTMHWRPGQRPCFKREANSKSWAAEIKARKGRAKRIAASRASQCGAAGARRRLNEIR